jgi:hypothetical protein
MFKYNSELGTMWKLLRKVRVGGLPRGDAGMDAAAAAAKWGSGRFIVDGRNITGSSTTIG